MILSCSKSVVMHANDLMDMQILEKKTFQPSTVTAPIRPAI